MKRRQLFAALMDVNADIKRVIQMRKCASTLRVRSDLYELLLQLLKIRNEIAWPLWRFDSIHRQKRVDDSRQISLFNYKNYN